MVSFVVPASWSLVAAELASYLAVLAASMVLRVVVKYIELTPLSSIGSTTIAILEAISTLSS